MNQMYIKLVNALISSNGVSALANKTGVDRKKVEQMAIEVAARALGDGSDLNKLNIEHRIKNLVKDDELKSILQRFSVKYGVSMQDASAVLTEILPSMFKNIEALDASYFAEEVKKEEIKHEVAYVAQSEPKSIDELTKVEPVQIKEETSVDDVFNNIEKKAKQELEPKKKIKKKKERKSLFARKKKEPKPVKEEKAETVDLDDGKLSLIEKLCIWIVLAALLALIGTIAFLFIRQKM